MSINRTGFYIFYMIKNSLLLTLFTQNTELQNNLKGEIFCSAIAASVQKIQNSNDLSVFLTLLATIDKPPNLISEDGCSFLPAQIQASVSEHK